MGSEHVRDDASGEEGAGIEAEQLDDGPRRRAVNVTNESLKCAGLLIVRDGRRLEFPAVDGDGEPSASEGVECKLDAGMPPKESLDGEGSKFDGKKK